MYIVNDKYEIRIRMYAQCLKIVYLYMVKSSINSVSVWVFPEHQGVFFASRGDNTS